MKLLIFDTETTGLINRKYKPACNNVHLQPHIVQLSYLIIDDNTLEVIKVIDKIIKMPENVNIPPESAKIHGITNTKSKEEGVSIKEVIADLLIDIEKVDMVICHNAEFDLLMLKIEITRMLKNTNVLTVFKKVSPYELDLTTPIENSLDDVINIKRLFCTMKATVDLCAIQRENSRGSYFKYPTLSELHEKMFTVKPKDLHNSLNDILITVRCFFMLEYEIDVVSDPRMYGSSLADDIAKLVN